MMFGRTTKTLAAICAVAGSLVGCGDSTDVLDGASVQVLLTDAPADYIASAMVDIGPVELVPADDGEPIVLAEDGTDGLVDLLDLQNEATMLLADADVDAGLYAQLRLIVESARVELIDGYTFTDGSTEKALFVPSGAQTGIKLNLTAADGDDEDAPLEITAEETTLVLDFDVDQSFVIQGAPDTPAGIMGVIFTPAIRVAVLRDAGTISGTVSTDLEGVAVEDLEVTAEPADDGMAGEFQTRTASARTNEDGTYTIHFVVPGAYTVTVAVSDDLATEPVSVPVDVAADADVSEIDFSIVPAG